MSDREEFRRGRVRKSASDKMTFRNTIDVEMWGHPKCGELLLVEVEFSATRGYRHGPANDPDNEAPETDILTVRPFKYKTLSTGFKSTEREYLDCPPWLADLLRDCVDADALIADWSDID